MANRFYKDYDEDSWPIRDDSTGRVLKTDEIVKLLNEFNDDQRLSEDPLTALAAVMQHQGLMIDSTAGRLVIAQAKNNFGVPTIILRSGVYLLTADEIKPE